MPLLSVAGVEVPVSVDSVRVQAEYVGSTGRNAAGWALIERRRRKRVIDASTPPLSIDEAALFRALLAGEGEAWSMASSVYGSKGYAITGTGSRDSSSGGNPLSTNGVWRIDASETMVVPWRFYDQSPVGPASAGLTGATLVGWRYHSTGPTWRCFGWSWRATETPSVTRQKLGALGSSGAAEAYAGDESFSAGASSLTVSRGAGASGWAGFSNLLLLPWYLPQAQVDQLLDGYCALRHVLPALPRVLVQSDLLPTSQLASPAGTNQAALVCYGDVREETLTPSARGGSWRATDMRLQFTLTEV